MNKERTSLFLMANLGAEASRIISAKEQKDTDATNAALNRAEKILAQIKDMSEMKSREKELDALGAVLRSYAKNNNRESVSAIHIKSYFMPFALRMLANRAQQIM